MSVISLDDLTDALPGLTIDDESSPTDTQVEGYIATVEAEVRARLLALGVPWPAAGSDAASFLRSTVLDGALAATLAAMDALGSQETAHAGTDRFARKYAADLAALPQIVRGIAAVAPIAEGRGLPVVSRVRSAPQTWESFEEFTQLRDPLTRLGRFGRRRWWGAMP